MHQHAHVDLVAPVSRSVLKIHFQHLLSCLVLFTRCSIYTLATLPCSFRMPLCVRRLAKFRLSFLFSSFIYLFIFLIFPTIFSSFYVEYIVPVYSRFMLIDERIINIHKMVRSLERDSISFYIMSRRLSLNRMHRSFYLWKRYYVFRAKGEKKKKKIFSFEINFVQILDNPLNF